MIDFWQRFFGTPNYDPNKGQSRFTPGGGTFPPVPPGQPFGQTGPGFTDDLGHPMHPLPGNFPTEMTDRGMIHPFDNTLALDAGMVQNPDFAFISGLGDDPKIYDEQSMQDLVSALRGSSPESLPNPAPNEFSSPDIPYGQPQPFPGYEIPSYSDPFSAPPELFNPNTTPTPGMETISMQSTGDYEYTDPNFEPPPLNQDYGADYTTGGNAFPSDVLGSQPPPNIPQYGGGEPSTTASSADVDWQWQTPQVQQLWQTTPDTSSPAALPGSTPMSMPPAPNFYDPNTYAPNSDPDSFTIEPDVIPGQTSGGYPTPPGITPDVLPAQPVDDYQGIRTSDLVHALAQDQADQSLGHQLGLPTDYKNIGNFFKDAAGNIVDTTGKIIATAAQLASQVPGALTDVGKGFINSLPTTSGGLGKPANWFGVPDNPLSPGYRGATSTVPGFGPGGSGTLANTGITRYDISRSGVSPTYGGNRSSVPAPPDLMPDTGGSMLNTGALWNGLFDRQRWNRLRKGIYTTPQEFGLMKHAMPTPSGGNIFNNPISGVTSFNRFHQGQVSMGDLLRANPALFSSPRTQGEAGKPARVGGGTPPTLPT